MGQRARVTGFLLALAPLASYGWGGVGHHTIGAIADLRLKGTNAESHVKALIAQGDPVHGVPAIDCSGNSNCTLAKYAVWADCAKGPTYCPKEEEGADWLDGEMRAYARKFTDMSVTPHNAYHHAFHYTDIPIEEDHYSEKSVGANTNDAVHILRDATAVLTNTGGNPRGLTEREALFVIAHVVGDLHQPLHVGAVYLAEDQSYMDPDTHPEAKYQATQGGNFLMLGAKNLHSYWDASTVQQVMTRRVKPASARTPAALAAVLVKKTVAWQTSGTIDGWPQAWADETLNVAQDAYKGLQLGEPENVQDEHTGTNHLQWKIDNASDYDRKWARDTAEAQVIKAGYRLAELLKQIWP